MFELIANYGTYFSAVLVTALAALLGRYVWNKITIDGLRAIAQRAYAEVIDAVLEVWQTYVSELKEAHADGVLTDEEKAMAKHKAIAIAKSNLGTKGLRRLARALGFGDPVEVERWIGGKVETAVATLKGAGMMQSPVAAAGGAATADPR
jgi:hypothetical protein